jgi:hypothetical protein
MPAKKFGSFASGLSSMTSSGRPDGLWTSVPSLTNVLGMPRSMISTFCVSRRLMIRCGSLSGSMNARDQNASAFLHQCW